MEVAGEITEQDYLRAHWLHIKPRRRYRIAGYLVLALFGLASIPVISVSVLSSQLELALSFFSPVVALVALAALRRHTHRRAYRGQPSLQGTHRYAFSQNQAVSESPLGKGEADWGLFTKWREDSRIFLLYQADNLSLMLPKRWFAGDEARSRELLEAHSVAAVDDSNPGAHVGRQADEADDE